MRDVFDWRFKNLTIIENENTLPLLNNLNNFENVTHSAQGETVFLGGNFLFRIFRFVPFRFVPFRFVPFRFANYSKPFHWPMPLNVAPQVAGKVLHCATWEKFLATLRDALKKVELTSTFRNDCGNTKNATNVCSRVCYTRQYFVQLVSQQNCETSCKRNCLV